GCDSSVLLNGSASGPGEQLAPPNLTLRPRAFTIIENIRSLVHAACNQTVSCSDITALAARDAVFLSGGPTYNVPLGRRDGVDFATRDETLANLPPFNATAANLTAAFALKGLDVTDLVALSGAHTIGRAECGSFERRMFPTQDPTMEQTFYNSLLATCPILNTTNTTMMDIRSPNVFDNRYYVNLMARQGLFTSDQDLFTDNTTSGIVEAFANNQTLFFENFVIAMIKMGQMNVTTGTQGEIRADCSIRNSNINAISLPGMESVNVNGKIASY
ncbi:peroxidase 12-like protein, partial [Tanacetum coccineum]